MIETYRKLGELLVDDGVIGRLELIAAIEAQGGTPHRLGRILIERGLATEADIARCLARQLGLELVEPRRFKPTPEALASVPFETAWQRVVLPIDVLDGTIECIVADPMDVEATDEVARATGLRIRLKVATESSLREEIERSYGHKHVTRLYRDPSAPTRYAEVVRRGEDAHGTWFLATDTTLRREVILSAVRSRSERHYDYLSLLQWTAAISHPMVAQVFDSRPHRQRRWSAIEAVPGETLAEIARRGTNRWGLDVLPKLADFADIVAQHPCGRLSSHNLLARGSNLRFVPVLAPEPLDDLTALGDIVCAAGQAAGPYMDLFFTLASRCRPGEPRRYSGPAELADALRQAERERRLGTNTTEERTMLFANEESAPEETNFLGRLRRIVRRAA